ncbi:MAG: hypothetical protein HPY50_13990 [Firmicutes bacterium]|nr:hypothetical protein [Bacillota bacterium]
MKYSLFWFVLAAILSFVTGVYGLIKAEGFYFLMWTFLSLVFLNAGWVLEKRKDVLDRCEMMDIYD